MSTINVSWAAKLSVVALLLAVLAPLSAHADDRSAAAIRQDPAGRGACTDLRSLKVSDTSITGAELVPAGSYQPPGSAQTFADLPAFCRVTARVTPKPDSSSSIELWLPAGHWNKRYLQVGTHGFGGDIYWNEMAPQLRRGFVTGATDSGHVGGINHFDSAWAIGHPEKVTDLAWRSVHELAVASKKIVKAYYGRPAAHAYYVGSSTGGRDGLKSAQMFPHDFDGILAGAAIQEFTRAGTQMLFTSKELSRAGLAGSDGARLLNLVKRSAVAACDAVDGVSDGIIGDPRDCTWDPQVLVCTPDQAPGTCLTSAQAAAVRASTSPLADPSTHRTFFVGQSVTSQPDWLQFILTPVYSLALYQIGLDDPTWNGTTFDLTADLPRVEANLGRVNATDPDLRSFKAAGGKIIQYQGWEDGVVLPESTVDYFTAVRAKTTRGSRAAQADFYRLFMIPGVSHVGAGAGPFNFGQEGQAAVSTDRDHDAVTALQDWVEHGRAPEKFVATKFANDDPSQGIALQRPLCPYPSRAAYRGQGSTNAASSFVCR